MFGAGLVLAFALLYAWASAMHGLDTCYNLPPAQGGAVYVRGGEPTFIRCLFYENVAELDGGAFSINGQLPYSPAHFRHIFHLPVAFFFFVRHSFASFE
jgi:hypothetical protein